jgi:hypothetical protein
VNEIHASRLSFFHGYDTHVLLQKGTRAMRHREPPSEVSNPLEALRADRALADTNDLAVRWLLRLLEGGEAASGGSPLGAPEKRKEPTPPKP